MLESIETSIDEEDDHVIHVHRSYKDARVPVRYLKLRFPCSFLTFRRLLLLVGL